MEKYLDDATWDKGEKKGKWLLVPVCGFEENQQDKVARCLYLEQENLGMSIVISNY